MQQEQLYLVRQFLPFTAWLRDNGKVLISMIHIGWSCHHIGRSYQARGCLGRSKACSSRRWWPLVTSGAWEFSFSHIIFAISLHTDIFIFNTYQLILKGILKQLRRQLCNWFGIGKPVCHFSVIWRLGPIPNLATSLALTILNIVLFCASYSRFWFAVW